MTPLLAALRVGLHRWRWRDTALGAMLGALCLLYMGGPLEPQASPSIWRVPLLYNVLQFGMPIVLAVRVADAAIDSGARAWLAYASAVGAVVVLGVWVIGPLLTPVLGGEPGWSLGDDIWLAAGIAVLLGLGVTGYGHWRLGERTRDQAQQAERQLAEQAQRLQSARLLALQAQVEPQLLFDALGRVAARLHTQPAGAEQLLSDTITLLRSLLPSTHSAASNVARELALVRAHARVTDQSALQPPLLQLAVAADTHHAELAPNVLPALLRELAARHSGWRLQAIRQGGQLQMQLQALNAGQPADDVACALDAVDLAACTQRLQAVHGPQARVRRPSPTLLQIELPYRHDPSADR